MVREVVPGFEWDTEPREQDDSPLLPGEPLGFDLQNYEPIFIKAEHSV